MAEDHYSILQVSPEATTSEITAAYRRLVLKYHPDKNSDRDAGAVFHKIQEAYETLTDANRRRAYNAQYENSKRREAPRTRPVKKTSTTYEAPKQKTRRENDEEKEEPSDDLSRLQTKLRHRVNETWSCKTWDNETEKKFNKLDEELADIIETLRLDDPNHELATPPYLTGHLRESITKAKILALKDIRAELRCKRLDLETQKALAQWKEVRRQRSEFLYQRRRERRGWTY